MEFALPQLLTRDDIITILNQRQLHVSNLNELTHEELMRVYNTFVMPLSQRPERSKRTPCTFSTHSNKHSNYEEQMCDEPFVANNNCMSMDIDMPHMPITTNDGQLGTHDKMTSPIGEKRRQRDSDDDEFIPTEKDYQYLLSSATKRIKINSLY